ncbi:FKBP-type peptidyl-prolyl cis-trans isomerase [Aliidiomarina sanyensis]|uniref:Peptidyl-prolyl cis-trans isomerase n=1 Tax=Aliidiomarina sanyensis TaxID=1249555 RepID=A0A432WRD3_9GAMM|nr:peptidylprolyl isomerase [Aliidiomarina sanyensis]RUO36334.1 peptidylprolyl isomerase [Aliidiomarina sanyensis]
MSQTISQDKAVTIHYVVKNAEGVTIDQSSEERPLAFIFGRGMLIPGLENVLNGKAAGDELSAEIPAADAYGERHDGLVQTVPRNLFGDQEVNPGMQFRATTDHGEQSVMVIEVTDETVTVDGNHPLAGVDLNFDVKVVDVRDATEEELSHGHVHGPGGVEH